MGPQSHVDANNAKAKEIRIADTVLNVVRMDMLRHLAGKLTNQETRTGYLSGTRGTGDENKSQSKCNFCGGTSMGNTIWQCRV